MLTRRPYETDLTDGQWQTVEPLFPCPRPAGLVGRPRQYCIREIIHAILYLVRTGCQWRLLPHDFPPYGIVLW